MQTQELAMKLLVAYVEHRKAREALRYGGQPARKRYEQALTRLRILEAAHAAAQAQPRR